MKQTTWLVVANGSSARILEVEKKNSFSEVYSLNHEESKLGGTQLKSDGPGKTRDRFGGGRHAMEDKTSPKEVEMQRFALEIAHLLDDARKHNRFHRVYLVSSPHFLGLLQGSLSNNVKKLIVENFSKDLTTVDPSELNKHITIRMPL